MTPDGYCRVTRFHFVCLFVFVSFSSRNSKKRAKNNADTSLKRNCSVWAIFLIKIMNSSFSATLRVNQWYRKIVKDTKYWRLTCNIRQVCYVYLKDTITFLLAFGYCDDSSIILNDIEIPKSLCPFHWKNNAQFNALIFVRKKRNGHWTLNKEIPMLSFFFHLMKSFFLSISDVDPKFYWTHNEMDTKSNFTLSLKRWPKFYKYVYLERDYVLFGVVVIVNIHRKYVIWLMDHMLSFKCFAFIAKFCASNKVRQKIWRIEVISCVITIIQNRNQYGMADEWRF